MKPQFSGRDPERLFRLLVVLFALVVMTTALCAGLHTVSDSDMGWHLATGRYVVQHHQIPRADILSFTSSGEPWAYPPFAGVLFYLVYSQFGYAGLSWVAALACLAIVAYLVRRRDIASIILSLLAVQSIAARTAPRADLFSTVFFALFLGELWSYHRGLRSRLWLFPVLMLCWVNLHPGFIAGLGALAAYVLLEIADLPFSERRQSALLRLRKSSPWLLAVIVVTVCNPWGVRIYKVAQTLSGLSGQVQGRINSSSFIGEFQGIPVSTHLLKQLLDVRHIENGLTWLLLIAVFLIGRALWQKQFGAAVLLAIALYAGLAHARYMALFAITITIIGGPLLQELCARESSVQQNLNARKLLPYMPDGIAFLLVVLLCGLAILHTVDYMTSHTYVVFNSDWRFGAGESAWFPERAAAFIERERLPGNIFEEYALGGYVAWRLGPQYPDFLDGRSDRLRPDLVVEQRRLYTADPDSAVWQASAQKWNLNIIIVATSGFRALQKLNPMAFCRSANWRAVYMDDASMVFVRNVQQNQPWIDRLAIDCTTQSLTPPTGASRAQLYDFYINSGALFFDLHRDAEAESALYRASQLYPKDPNVHLLLAGLRQRQGDLRATEQEYLISLALNDNSNAWFALGNLYAYEGRSEEAIRAIKTAAGMSVEPVDMYLVLGQLELAQHNPEQALEMYGKAESSSPFRAGGESLAPELYARIAEGRSEAHRLAGRWPEAIQFQLEAVQLTPGDKRRLMRLANLYEATGQRMLAAEVEQKASELDSQVSSRP